MYRLDLLAGGVPDAHEHGTAEPPRLFERLVSPGIPVDRVVRVLEKVGTCLQEEPVRVFRPPAWPVVSRPRLVPFSAHLQCLCEPIRQFRIDPGYARRRNVRWQSFHREFS